MDNCGLHVRRKFNKDLSVAKTIAYKDPEFISNVTYVLSDIIIKHIIKQIESGVDMIQIFDTHSNTLDYYSKEKYSIEPVKIFARGKNYIQLFQFLIFLKTLTIV